MRPLVEATREWAEVAGEKSWRDIGCSHHCREESRCEEVGRDESHRKGCHGEEGHDEEDSGEEGRRREARSEKEVTGICHSA